MTVVSELTDEQWSLMTDLFDPPGRRGAPARIESRQMVNATLFLVRTGCPWRYLPYRFRAGGGGGLTLSAAIHGFADSLDP